MIFPSSRSRSFTRSFYLIEPSRRASYHTRVRRALLALVALLLGATAASAAPAAPGFRVKQLEGNRTFDSRDMIGKKVVVLRFQTSYCKPCVKESAALSRLTERYGSRGVEVLAPQRESSRLGHDGGAAGPARPRGRRSLVTDGAQAERDGGRGHHERRRPSEHVEPAGIDVAAHDARVAADQHDQHVQRRG